MNQIYCREEYIVFPVRNGYIVCNTTKDFQEAHSHIKHFKPCIDLINFAIHKKIPKKCSNYYLHSLIRITTDEVFREKIRQLIATRLQKGRKPSYYNRKAV